MNPMWLTVSYLVTLARCRARAVRAADREAGALTLEWLVIAGILVVAATAAGVAFKSAIQSELAKLP
jgi:hypothetical protein